MALVGAACSDDAPTTSPDPTIVDDGSGNGSGSGGSGNGGTGSGRSQFLRALTPFADCSAFLDHVKQAARDRVGPYGLEGGPVYWIEDDVLFEADMDVAASDGGDDSAGGPVAAPRAQTGDSDSGGGTEFTGTNVQELGVDEPDIIKTDGDRILAISENVLTYVDVASGDPAVTDRITLPEGWGHELFFAGDRALLFTNGGNWGWPMPVDPLIVDGDAEAQFAGEAVDEMIAPEHHGPAVLILEIDLSDPSELEIAASMRIEGQYLSARSIGHTVRLAISSSPTELPWLYPQSAAGEERATEANREIVDESTLDDWTPSFTLTTDDSEQTGPLLDCSRMHHPAEFSGFELISIVDLDIADGIADRFDARDAVGVLAGGQTIYSSTDRFYVATTKWAGADLALDDVEFREWNENYETDLHAFAISPDEPTQYVASGSVDGSLLNQFSLDEHDGLLRAITTTGSPWSRSNESQTQLVVLDEQGDQLVEVGHVGGLGRGENLYSARLLDDVGFAVTFRQIDPFYVLDLGDPAAPRVAGELKIPGFSTYLHPVGDDRVLGVGQDATPEGATLGLKLSLFDVSNPSDPREVAVWTLRDANSPVEYDHRAFQMWGSTAIVPVQSWSGSFNGAIVFDIGDETITELGRISHIEDGAAPSSDCRVLGVDDVPEESELFWLTQEAHVQICESDQVGGYGGRWCEVIPASDIKFWVENEAVGGETMAELGIDDDDRIELCWPDEYYVEQIQRSLVIDGTVWTMTPSALQANDLTSFDVLAHLSLR
jgi:hypothetical protein